MPAPAPGRPVRPATTLVIMGVAGSGKSTVMAELAGRLGWRTPEGDGLHPPGNVAKMAAGRSLTDEDREPWLAAWSASSTHGAAEPADAARPAARGTGTVLIAGLESPPRGIHASSIRTW